MNERTGPISSLGLLLLLGSTLLTGCGSQLFSRDEPWRIPESTLKSIENSDLQTSAEHLSMPPEGAVQRVLEGAIEFPNQTRFILQLSCISKIIIVLKNCPMQTRIVLKLFFWPLFYHTLFLL